jgi:hypothetical protein
MPVERSLDRGFGEFDIRAHPAHIGWLYECGDSGPALIEMGPRPPTPDRARDPDPNLDPRRSSPP